MCVPTEFMLLKLYNAFLAERKPATGVHLGASNAAE